MVLEGCQLKLIWWPVTLLSNYLKKKTLNELTGIPFTVGKEQSTHNK